MMRAKQTLGIIVVSILCAVSYAGRANAGHIYHLGQGGDPIFSGTPPAGAGPWVDVYFQDAGAGAIFLTVSNVGLSGDEKLTQLYLNLNPVLDPTSLIFTLITATPGVFVPTQANGAISEGVNTFKADGDGKYDILFDFSTTPTTSFTGGEYVSYLVSGIPGLSTLDFYRFLSAPAGGHGPFFAAAHIQSIAYGEGSGWIFPPDSPEGVELSPPVPEPGSASVLLLGAAAAFMRRARRQA